MCRVSNRGSVAFINFVHSSTAYRVPDPGDSNISTHCLGLDRPPVAGDLERWWSARTLMGFRCRTPGAATATSPTFYAL